MKKQTYHFLIPFLFSLAALFFWCAATSTSFAATRHGFALHSRSITVGDTTTYQINGLRKKQSAKFFCSNANLATIQKKTGQLTAKKAGTVTISAKIYNKKGKKINTLKTNLIIQKRTILPNASFKVNGSINPWNFQIQLSCSRILLEKEVEESSLTIISKKNKNKKISAAFCNLSTDGKEVTYTIPDASQKILCPGDTSMNGTYEITSTIFLKTLSISYQERIADDTVSGFIMQNNGNPVQNALVRINTVSNTMETSTDNTGYYQIKNVKNPSSMSVSKEGYQTQNLDFSSDRKGALCENFVLKKNSKNTALECIITDENNMGIADAVVTLSLSQAHGKLQNARQIIQQDTIQNMQQNRKILSQIQNLSEEDCIFYQAITDKNGKVTFDNDSSDNLQQTDCSIIYPETETQLSYVSSYSFSSTNRCTISPEQFSPESVITIYVSKNYMDFTSSTHYEIQKCQLSFEYLMSNYASLRICLKEITYRPLQTLSIQWDSTYPISDCHKLSLSLYHQTQKKPIFQRILSANEFSMGITPRGIVPTGITSTEIASTGITSTEITSTKIASTGITPTEITPIEILSSETMQKSQNTTLTILSEAACPILPDGNFLVTLSAFDAENILLAESTLQPCYLENGCLYATPSSLSTASKSTKSLKTQEKTTISLQTPHYIRILLYTDNLTIPDKRMSATFQLYQKKDDHYYFLGDFDSDKFFGNAYSPKTANLAISGIFPEENYLIVPASSSPLSGDCHTIPTANLITYPNKETALASPNPFFQIYCCSSDDISFPAYPDDFYQTPQTNDMYTAICNMSIQNSSNITQSLIRSSNTYPNSVVAFYQKDGNLIASSLLPRPVHISDVTEPDNAPLKSSVIDIYTNGETLITNQFPYRSSI